MIEKAAQTESPFLTPCKEKLEVIDSIQDHIGDQLSLLSLPGKEKNWQPTDFLPDLSKDGWEKEVEELR
ncbi:MAG: acyl-ACP desaturase, partial [Candidatus Omnitrophica bacterium]|nr:acyl-ACP desaturase [Candidatus Omnitrophota bacterium]